jgi:DNA-binding response OmpR family regulator
LVNVLIIDDDPAIGRLLRVILSLEGMEVAQAHSGEAAIDYLDEVATRPDFILLDIAMPGMNGLEVFQEARRVGVACPIVFCSSYGAEKANRELGAQGAIQKPFDPLEIISLVRSLTSEVEAS